MKGSVSSCNLWILSREESTATTMGVSGGCRAPGLLCPPATAYSELTTLSKHCPFTWNRGQDPKLVFIHHSNVQRLANLGARCRLSKMSSSRKFSPLFSSVKNYTHKKIGYVAGAKFIINIKYKHVKYKDKVEIGMEKEVRHHAYHVCAWVTDSLLEWQPLVLWFLYRLNKRDVFISKLPGRLCSICTEPSWLSCAKLPATYDLFSLERSKSCIILFCMSYLID